VRLTDDGVAVMQGRRAARWLPPPEAAPKSRKRTRAGAAAAGSAGIAAANSAARARSASAYKAPGTRASGAATLADDFDAADQALFDSLRTARLDLAQQQGVPAYIVAHDRTLRELVRLKPGTPEALAEVPGFGPLKVERYGAKWLAVIAAHAAGMATMP
jgi:ATP-dependent DNA helicase RecQ